MMEVLVPVLTALIASLGTYFATRSTNMKDVTVNAGNNLNSGRESLSEDERLFRKELRESIVLYKEELSQLREEVKLLREINLQLELENRELSKKVDALTQQVLLLNSKGNQSVVNELIKKVIQLNGDKGSQEIQELFKQILAVIDNPEEPQEQ